MAGSLLIRSKEGNEFWMIRIDLSWFTCSSRNLVWISFYLCRCWIPFFLRDLYSNKQVSQSLWGSELPLIQMNWEILLFEAWLKVRIKKRTMRQRGRLVSLNHIRAIGSICSLHYRKRKHFLNFRNLTKGCTEMGDWKREIFSQIDLSWTTTSRGREVANQSLAKRVKSYYSYG